MGVYLHDTGLIERVSGWIPETAIVVSSDLRRASLTADAICKGRCRLPDSAELREINFGAWEGLTHDQIARADPSLSKRYWADPSCVAPPGGEHWLTVANRVDRFVDRLIDQNPGRDIVAVAHFGVILTQVQRATKVGFPKLSERPVKNLSVTRISHMSGDWRLHEFSYRP